MKQLRPCRYAEIQTIYSNICFHFYIQTDTLYQVSPVTHGSPMWLQLICPLGWPGAPHSVPVWAEVQTPAVHKELLKSRKSGD